MSVAPLLATVVDTSALLRTVIASFVAGFGVILVFSVAIFGAARSAELGREGRTAAAAAHGALSILAIAACAAAIVVGIIVMTSK
jgi:hypothetical protein